MKKRKFLLPFATIVGLFSTNLPAALDEQHSTEIKDDTFTDFGFILKNNNDFVLKFAAHRSHRSHSSHRSHYSSYGTGTYKSDIPLSSPGTVEKSTKVPETIYIPSDASGTYNGIPIYDVKKK